MKTIVMSLLGALISMNAMASVRCFVQVDGQAKPLEATKEGSVVLQAVMGTIQATVVASLDSQDEVTDLQIKDSTQNFSVMSVGANDLSKRPAVLFANLGSTQVTLTCSR